VANVVGWAINRSRGPPEVSDRIRIVDTAGDVIELWIFRLRLLEIGNRMDADE
jgi:hypothetical protein